MDLVGPDLTNIILLFTKTATETLFQHLKGG